MPDPCSPRYWEKLGEESLSQASLNSDGWRESEKNQVLPVNEAVSNTLMGGTNSFGFYANRFFSKEVSMKTLLNPVLAQGALRHS